MNIELNIKSLKNIIEKDIIKKLDLHPPTSYLKLADEELDKIYDELQLKYNDDILTKDIILSIRSMTMKMHMIVAHKNLLKNKKNIIKDYEKKKDLLEIVEKYDGSPLNILRIVFDDKYHIKIKFLYKNKILDNYDKNTLEYAVKNDVYALINNKIIMKKAMDFEYKIFKLLRENKVRFKTQYQLAKEKKHITPDFLLIDGIYINGNKIKWIDAKNFYGLKNNLFIDKINIQMKKYINKWGMGAIIFSLGFNDDMKFDNILLIDYNSFYDKLNKN